MAGAVFAKGALPANSNVVTSSPAMHAVVKRRWNDGSPKHVVLAGVLDCTANTAHTLTLAAGIPAGTNLIDSDILAVNPVASVSLGSHGTANLGPLLGSPVRTWISTPDMVECHYLSKPAADIYVWFQVRLWSSGHTWVRAVVEYSKLPFTDSTLLTYAPSVTIGANVVWNNGGADYRHGLGTRWSVEGWAAGSANYTVRHDTNQLRDTKLVPNYLARNPTEAQLNALGQTYAPGSIVNLRSYYPGTGYDRQIGLLPEWDMLYAVSGDARAWRSVQANSFAAGTHATIWRDPNTNLIRRPSDWTTWTLAGANQGGHGQIGTVSQTVGTSYVWDTAHNASSGYFAYLITGDHLHLETMHQQSAAIYLFTSSSNGAGTHRRVFGQTRSQGWFFRTVGQLVAVAPEGDTVAADMADWLHNNALFHKANGPDGAYADTIGYPVTIGTYNAGGPLEVAPWMHHFWI